MTISVSGRHVDISDAFKGHVLNGLNELWAKHHVTPVEAHVILSKEGVFFSATFPRSLVKALPCDAREKEIKLTQASTTPLLP